MQRNAASGLFTNASIDNAETRYGVHGSVLIEYFNPPRPLFIRTDFQAAVCGPAGRLKSQVKVRDFTVPKKPAMRYVLHCGNARKVTVAVKRTLCRRKYHRASQRPARFNAAADKDFSGLRACIVTLLLGDRNDGAYQQPDCQQQEPPSQSQSAL
jgi:hypothetical protein